jgi:hypothetical protein
VPACRSADQAKAIRAPSHARQGATPRPLQPFPQPSHLRDLSQLVEAVARRGLLDASAPSSAAWPMASCASSSPSTCSSRARHPLHRHRAAAATHRERGGVPAAAGPGPAPVARHRQELPHGAWPENATSIGQQHRRLRFDQRFRALLGGSLRQLESSSIRGFRSCRPAAGWCSIACLNRRCWPACAPASPHAGPPCSANCAPWPPRA